MNKNKIGGNVFQYHIHMYVFRDAFSTFDKIFIDRFHIFFALNFNLQLLMFQFSFSFILYIVDFD